MSILETFKASFPLTVQTKGRQYVRENRVKIVRCDDELATCRVKGSGDEVYEVHVDWKTEGVIRVNCSCPYFLDHGPCKHLWATLLSIDPFVSSDFGDHVDYDEEFNPENRNLNQLIDNFVSRTASTLGKQNRRSNKKKKPPSKPVKQPDDWKSALKHVKHSPLPAANPWKSLDSEEYRYLLNIESSQASGSIKLNVECRTRGINGTFGRWKPKNLNAAYGHSSSRGEMLLNRLLSLFPIPPHQYGSINTISIAILDQFDLLQELCDSQSIVLPPAPPHDLAQSIAWDAQGPWRLKITVAESKHSTWKISAHFLQP